MVRLGVIRTKAAQSHLKLFPPSKVHNNFSRFLDHNVKENIGKVKDLIYSHNQVHNISPITRKFLGRN